MMGSICNPLYLQLPFLSQSFKDTPQAHRQLCRTGLACPKCHLGAGQTGGEGIFPPISSSKKHLEEEEAAACVPLTPCTVVGLLYQSLSLKQQNQTKWPQKLTKFSLHCALVPPCCSPLCALVNARKIQLSILTEQLRFGSS